MAFSTVLPKVVYDVEAGGPLVTGSKGVNALIKGNLENQYYAPDMESQINNRNALTQGQNIENKYMPDKLRLGNAFAELQNRYYGPNIESEIGSRNALTRKTNTMLPLEKQELELKNKFYPQLTQADINYKNMGGGRGSVAQKDLMAFNNQLQMDNPIKPNEDVNAYNDRINAMSDAYGKGQEALSDGTKLPPLSWKAQQLQNNVMNRNVPAAVRNQLSSMDVLVNDLSNFDIDAVKSFTGPIGKAKLGYAKAQMVVNPDDPKIDPMARRYISAMNDTIINMDQMRKSFGTSVVPDYVYKTVGKLTNPNSSIWNDSTQVAKSFDDVVKTMSRNRDMLKKQYRQGLAIPSGSNNERQASENIQKPLKITTDGKVKVRNKKNNQEGFIPVDRLEAYKENGYEAV